jgi:formylglycine-generating enzyme required for sulfatase activity
MKLVLIPPGKFIMGSPKVEEGRHENEVQHEVEITKAYYLGAYPVTIGQFRQFVQGAGYKTEAEMDGQGGYGYNPTTRSFEGRKEAYTWRNVGWEQTDEHPVVNVTWNDSIAFCRWLSGREGKTYELPTEAEWEYACRAGTVTRFYNGDKDERLKDIANIADSSLKAKLDPERYKNFNFQSWDDGHPFTAPVGSFRPNGWKLYDMHGNVWQWCADWYGNYPEESSKDPKGPDKAGQRVVRGGSWHFISRDCRAAKRYGGAPNYCDVNFGIRVACRLSPKTP